MLGGEEGPDAGDDADAALHGLAAVVPERLLVLFRDPAAVDIVCQQCEDHVATSDARSFHRKATLTCFNHSSM